MNYTDDAIELRDYTANPDHKSIPVRDVPEHYWQCLVYHEDRNLGGWLNPFGIDLLGVLKIPYSTLERSIARRRPSLGVGGSTLPMQFVRVIYKTPPHGSEGGLTKLKRKITEWWLAPVVYRELTRGGDATRLKQWAANHLWLAQRTGGTPLHGIEVTSRIVFGKEASDLSIAEQFVLASAVNQPIILLEGSDRLNDVRLDRWRYLTEVRARLCAEKLLTDEAEQKQVVFDLIAMAGGPPDPKVKPKLQAALERYAPAVAHRAEANPDVRANALMPSARYGMREEMKQAYGFGWREHVRGVTTTFEVADNLAFGERIKTELARLDTALRDRIAAATRSIRPRLAPIGRRPTSSSSPPTPKARSFATTRRARRRPTSARSARATLRPASTSRGVIRAWSPRPARSSRPSPSPTAQGHAQFALPRHPGAGARAGNLRQGLGAPRPAGHRRLRLLAQRAADEPHGARRAGARQKLIDDLGFNMPPGDTPPSTAVVLGQISGAPRRVHQMSAVVLARSSVAGHCL